MYGRREGSESSLRRNEGIRIGMALFEHFQPPGSHRLTFTIKLGELIAINGVLIKVWLKDGQLAITICGEKPRVLVGRQLMRADDARTPLDRIYLLIQEIFLCDGGRLQAVIGDIVDRIKGLPEFQLHRPEHAYIESAIDCINGGLYHRALRSIREMYERFYPHKGWPGTRPAPTDVSEIRPGRR